jgi:hypothetical protein
MTIEKDRQSLYTLLQQALEIELFTVGPYLTALYSVLDGANKVPAGILKSVVMEEMLHMALVANVMNAIGGKPRLCCEQVEKEGNPRVRLEIRKYPSNLPHVDRNLPISLRRFSRAAIEDFREIERPDDPKSWCGNAPRQAKFSTIGQFYEALINQLITASNQWGEKALFNGPRDKQISRVDYYGAGGNVTPVHSLADAKDALSEVAQQGEGRRYTNQTGDSERFDQPKEVAHFYRFEEILAGRRYDRDDDVSLEPSGERLFVDWEAVYPMDDNPSAEKVQPAGVKDLLRAFERAYSDVLQSLHQAFNGKRCALRDKSVPAMHQVREASIGLLTMNSSSDRSNGPPFWFVELVDQR